MARTPVWGSASRSRRPLVPPAAARGLLRVGGAAVATAALAVGLHLAGGPSALSPGPLSAAHLSAATRCGDCHGAGRADAGCARCHAATPGERFAATGHAPAGPGAGPNRGGSNCVTCHREHRGEPAPRVPDERCAGCHFSSLDVHPAPLTRAVGPRASTLSFGHAGHLMELEREGQLGEDACATCHGPRSRVSRPRFEACARCHAPEGMLGAVSVARSEVALPQELEDAGLEMAIATNVEQAGSSVFATVGHRDPWLILNLERAISRGATETARALAAPCGRCHRDVMRGVAGGGAPPGSLVSRFDHGRHPQSCANCHADVAGAVALPMAPPDPAACLACHRQGNGSRDCVTCHRYHAAGR